MGRHGVGWDDTGQDGTGWDGTRQDKMGMNQEYKVFQGTGP